MICTEVDEHLASHMEGNAIWVVKLNDGTLVYQDDHTEQQPSAWERLWQHCAENNLYIVDMYVKFRSNVHHLQSNQHGYFFSKCATGHFGNNKTFHSFVVGTLLSGRLRVCKLSIPELLVEWEEERDPSTAGISLICQ